MSLPRPSGIKQPTRIGRPSGLPTTRPLTPAGGSSTNQTPQNNNASAPTTKAINAIAKSARGVGFCPEHADQYADDTSKVLKGPEPLEDEFSSEDFKIGDRIWVSGNKPGIIAFIGEAQFAPGEWAGIVLDEPIGKNDGSVMGVRYFQCEPKRGVFSRLNKLSLTPQSPSRPLSQGHDSSSSESKLSNSDSRTVSTTNGTTVAGSAVLSRPSSRLGLSASKNLSTSSSSLHKASSAGTTPTGTGGGMKLPGTTVGGVVKVGDRVLVSGSKPGILRFIGETDFAKGIWAGVDLDEPLGKNDGAVAGKRYFDCKSLHGLFAPVHKISQVDLGVSTPSPHSRPLMSTSLRSSRERSGSQESVSSLSSTASSVSRSRVRLGVTSLASQASKTGQRPNTLNLSATTAALQKALKEKEEHIEQLLRERDLERSEVARAAAHVDEAEGQLSFIKTEQSRWRLEADEQIGKYRTLVAELEVEKQELLTFLEEEKRKVEDLQFQLEEETLKDDIDNKSNATSELQLKELERQIRKEKERADNLENELNLLKQKLEDQQRANIDAKTRQTSMQDIIEDLTHKLTQAESKVKTFEMTRLESGAKAGQISIELTEKQNKVRELEEQLALQRREMSSMSQQFSDLKEELTTSNEKRKKQDEYIKELTDKLKQTENQQKDMMDEIRNANSNTADLQRQLTASKTKAEELANDRAILELQLSELMKNSGDNSSQLATLNDQLMERNRKIEDLQNDLLNYSQNLAKAQESYQGLLQEKDRDIQEVTQNFQNRIVKLEDELSELNSVVEKSKARAGQLSEIFESEKKEALERKDTEIRELQQQLLHLNDELCKQQDKTTAHKQLLEKVTLEKEALQYEKQQAEKHLKRVEVEKDAINRELIQASVEVTKYQEEVEKSKRTKLDLEDRVEKQNLQVEFITKAKEEADKSRDEVKSQKAEVVQENDLLKQECNTLRGEVQKKDILLSDMQKEVNKLHTESSKKVEELMSKSQTETDLLTQELSTLRALLQETKGHLESKVHQVAELQAQVEQNETLAHERDLLQKEKTELLKEKQASEDRCRSFIKEVDKQSQKATELQSEVRLLQSSEEALKQEKSALKDRVGQLETELEKARKDAAEAISKAAAAADVLSDNAVYSQLKEEEDLATRQVDFLNSVIVELQNKNQELQHRLSVMEDSGINTNGEFIETTETPTRARAPPRLFCDICDMFDLHDTEDCPKQAMSNSPEPTRHHGERKSTRPYCDICEVFSELCECGAFSPETMIHSWSKDTKIGTDVRFSTSAEECDEFYPPPDGFGAEVKQNCPEHTLCTVSEELTADTFGDRRDEPQDMEIRQENNDIFRDFFKSNASEISCPLTEINYINNELSLTGMDSFLCPELHDSPTAPRPDLLQGCDKVLTSFFNTTKDEVSKPNALASNDQKTSHDVKFCDDYGSEVNVNLKNDNSFVESMVQNLLGECEDFSRVLFDTLENYDSQTVTLENATFGQTKDYSGVYEENLEGVDPQNQITCEKHRHYSDTSVDEIENDIYESETPRNSSHLILEMYEGFSTVAVDALKDFDSEDVYTDKANQITSEKTRDFVGAFVNHGSVNGQTGENHDWIDASVDYDIENARGKNSNEITLDKNGGFAEYLVDPSKECNTQCVVSEHVNKTTFGQYGVYVGPSNDPSYAEPSNEPSYAEPSNDPLYAEPSNDPSYAGLSNDPSYAGPSNDPSYAGPSNHPSYAGPSNDPSYAVPSNDPSYAEPSKKPSYAEPLNDPSYAEPSNDPYAEPSNDPSYAGPSNDPSYAEPSNDPSYAGPSNDPSYAEPSNDPSYAGPSNDPSYAGPSNDPSYAGLSNDPSYAGPSNDPSYAGLSNDPSYAGLSNDPSYAEPSNDPYAEPSNDPSYAEPSSDSSKDFSSVNATPGTGNQLSFEKNGVFVENLIDTSENFAEFGNTNDRTFGYIFGDPEDLFRNHDKEFVTADPQSTNHITADKNGDFDEDLISTAKDYDTKSVYPERKNQVTFGRLKDDTSCSFDASEECVCADPSSANQVRFEKYGECARDWLDDSENYVVEHESADPDVELESANQCTFENSTDYVQDVMRDDTRISDFFQDAVKGGVSNSDFVQDAMKDDAKNSYSVQDAVKDDAMNTVSVQDAMKDDAKNTDFEKVHGDAFKSCEEFAESVGDLSKDHDTNSSDHGRASQVPFGNHGDYLRYLVDGSNDCNFQSAKPRNENQELDFTRCFMDKSENNKSESDYFVPEKMNQVVTEQDKNYAEELDAASEEHRSLSTDPENAKQSEEECMCHDFPGDLKGASKNHEKKYQFTYEKHRVFSNDLVDTLETHGFVSAQPENKNQIVSVNTRELVAVSGDYEGEGSENTDQVTFPVNRDFSGDFVNASEEFGIESTYLENQNQIYSQKHEVFAKSLVRTPEDHDIDNIVLVDHGIFAGKISDENNFTSSELENVTEQGDILFKKEVSRHGLGVRRTADFNTGKLPELLIVDYSKQDMEVYKRVYCVDDNRVNVDTKDEGVQAYGSHESAISNRENDDNSFSTVCVHDQVVTHICSVDCDLCNVDHGQEVKADDETDCRPKNVHSITDEVVSEVIDWADAHCRSIKVTVTDPKAETGIMNSNHFESSDNLSHDGIGEYYQDQIEGYDKEEIDQTWDELLSMNRLSDVDFYQVDVRDFGITGDSQASSLYHVVDDDDDSGTAV